MKQTILISMLMLFYTFVSAQTNSVLATGNWYKIAVDQTGIFKITYSDLQAIGIDPSTINPQNIKIYGNGNDMLHEWNHEDRPEDLTECAITVLGEGDGTFDTDDYILFYGEGPINWEYDSDDDMFLHSLHLYSSEVYYFMTIGTDAGKRLDTIPLSSETATHMALSFDDRQVMELEMNNFLNSGKLWVGEDYDVTDSRDYGFIFPNRVDTSVVKLKSDVYARSNVGSNFDITVNGAPVLSQAIAYTNTSSSTAPYANYQISNTEFNTGGSSLLVNVTYDKPNSESVGWINYLNFNARRDLIVDDSQLLFRDLYSVGAGNLTAFYIAFEGTGSNMVIWNVTDPQNAIIQGYQPMPPGGLMFKTHTDSLKEFIVFDESDVYSPLSIHMIDNQNLHAISDVDMIIVTHEDFEVQAVQLANHHLMIEGIYSEVVTTEEIYNEFSSGMQDVSAIRDFMKYLYENASSEDSKPKYLLLFGDASYDYKDITSGNTNYVPVYQTEQSTRLTESLCSDDFYGLLDDTEGQLNGVIDIGIGRIPVQTITQAQDAVDKIIHYNTDMYTTGPWRNKICLIADDEDGNAHQMQAENHYELLDTALSCYFIDKIYLDAYTQVSGGTSAQYPEAKEDITELFNDGTLLINYTGHGNEEGWAHEEVLDAATILSNDNLDHLPFVVSASCEFNHFDDPEQTSQGKELVLSVSSGSIGVFSAARYAYSSPSYTLNRNLLIYLSGEDFDRIGDAVKYAKSATGSGLDKRKYLLLGDPAIKLKFPENVVYTTYINGVDAALVTDTFTTGEVMNIEGYIGDVSGSVLSYFTGDIYYSLFNPIRTDTTLANDGGATMTFDIQNDIIYSDNTFVTDGYFNFSLTIPIGVSVAYGAGKILFYADNDSTDATGCYTGAIIGDSEASIPDLLLGDISVYPTLVNEMVFFDLNSIAGERANIAVYSISGSLVHSESIIVGDSEHQLNLSNFNKGMYMINIETNKGVYRAKIIKQ